MNTNDKTPSLHIYHANPKGTGCAARMTLHPANGESDGAITLTLAAQKTVGRSPDTFPTFDWDNAAEVTLAFDDLTQMLQVFRGECETIADGKGLYHRYSQKWQNIRLEHVIDPTCGYSLEVTQNRDTNGETTKHRILLTTYESLGICEAFASSLGRICFG